MRRGPESTYGFAEVPIDGYIPISEEAPKKLFTTRRVCEQLGEEGSGYQQICMLMRFVERRQR